MPRQAKVAVIVGSLRKDSVNRKVAKAVADLARPHLDLEIVEIGDLPLYSEDFEAELPAAVRRFKDQVEAADAVLFVTPEYNRTFSAALKNAIEWGTRPWGQNSFNGKPGAVIGATLGAVGTGAAQAQLRSVVSVLGVALNAQPEIYLNYRAGQIDEDGRVVDENLKTMLTAWVGAFSAWVDRLAPQPSLALAS